MFNMTNNTNDLNTKTAVYAGGCFWCTESDLRKVPGVVDVISGYVGEARPDGSLPSYENHNGFREAVRVIYDPVATNFKKLTQFFVRCLQRSINVQIVEKMVIITNNVLHL